MWTPLLRLAAAATLVAPAGAVGYAVLAPKTMTLVVDGALMSPMTEGVPFSQALVATGEAPVTWDDIAGAFPAGITMSSDGVVSGTPTTAGSGSVTVKAGDIEGTDEVLAWTVSAPPSGPMVQRTAGSNDRNGTTSQVVNFAPAAKGNLLVMVLAAPAIIADPTDWPTSGWVKQVGAYGGLGIFTKTATAWESSVTLEKDPEWSNYPLSYAVYEFPGTYSVGATQSQIGVISAAAGPTITGMTGTNIVLMASSNDVNSGSGITAQSKVWGGNPAAVEDTDEFLPVGETDGGYSSIAYVDNVTAATYAATFTKSLTGGDYGEWRKFVMLEINKH